MKIENLPYTILLVLGILALIKSAWAVVRPGDFKRLCIWWTSAALKVNTLAGIVCAVFALALLGVVLMRQPLANWLLVALGLVFAWAASLYFRPPAFERAMRVMILDRKPGAIRVMFVFWAIVGAALIVVGIQGL